MDAFQKANKDMNILLNITDVLKQDLKYHQIYTYSHTILAYLRDCLTYMRQVGIHTMDYVEATMNNILSPDMLPVGELRTMFRHTEVQLPSITHLSILLDNMLYFYWYLKTHMLVADGQLLLLLDAAIQDRAQQLQIYEFLNLPVPHGDVTGKYKVSDKYIGITCDETQVGVITEQQYSTCLHANGQFCKIDAPFQVLTNPPTCIKALKAKNDHEIETQCSLSIFHK